MEGSEIGDLDIMIGHLSDRGYFVRPSRLQLTVRWLMHLQLTLRWLIVAVSVLVLDAAAVNWTFEVRKPIDVRWSFSDGVSQKYCSVNDGSLVCAMNGPRIGENTVRWIHLPTAKGLCYVWWPSVGCGALTLAARRVGGDTQGASARFRIPGPPEDSAAMDDRGGRQAWRSGLFRATVPSAIYRPVADPRRLDRGTRCGGHQLDDHGEEAHLDWGVRHQGRRL